jgi:23S rRNA pseudouridine1911/1915/1917 synthase
MIDETIPAALDGERLDRVVAIITAASRADAALLVTAGGASVDGVVVTTGKVRLREGQHVVVDPSLLPVPELPSADATVDFTVVFADAHVVVIDKPAGLVVHPGAGRSEGTLVNGLLARFPEMADVGEPHRPGIVHRLDVGTSGLMVAARSQDAYHALVGALSEHRVERTYRTLVWGCPASPVGVIDGKPARTHYRVLHRFRDHGEIAEVRCRLETGRTHQIRVHLAAIGHPVVGDATYGGTRTALVTQRPMLHAEALAFEHPVDGTRLEFTSELPDDMRAVLAGLGVAEEVVDPDRPSS